jgi:hypothetical protein
MLAAALVGWLVALLGDRTLKGGARIVLGTPEQRALAAAMDVALKAMIRDLPDQSGKSFVSALRECFDQGPAVPLDGRTRVRAGLVKAIGQQISPLAEPITPAGTSFFEEIDVDPAWVRDQLAEVVIRSVEQIGASTAALTPLVAQMNADAIIGKFDEVNAALSRLEARQQRQSAGGRAAGTEGRMGDEPDLSPDELGRIVKALLNVPVIRDDSSRQQIINGLPDPIPNAVPRAALPGVQVLAMVRTCLNYSGGLRALVDLVRLLEGESLAMRKLDDVILGLAAASDGRGSGARWGQAADV